jgi:hypothetical protein
MMTSILSSREDPGRRAQQHFKQWTIPVNASMVTSAPSDPGRSHADPFAENLVLRQRLTVLNQQVE